MSRLLGRDTLDLRLLQDRLQGLVLVLSPRARPLVRFLTKVDKKKTSYDASIFPLSYAKPLLPFEQLMVVLPPESQEFVPESHRVIMRRESTFFPTEFDLDTNNKRFLWQAIPLLPHLKLDQLLEILDKDKAVQKDAKTSELNTVHKDVILNPGRGGGPKGARRRPKRGRHDRRHSGGRYHDNTEDASSSTITFF